MSNEEKPNQDSNNMDIEDSVKMYLKEISKFPLLTPEEEKELAIKIQSGNSKEKKSAIKKLTNSNLRLVVSIAKKYVNEGSNILDLIQEGNIGLMHAAQKFDYTQKTKFSTYARYWIESSIKKAKSNQSRLIRLPINQIELLSKIKKAKEQLFKEKKSEPTNDDIAYRLNMPVEKIEELLNITQELVDLDGPVADNGKSIPISEAIADKSNIALEEKVRKGNLQEILEKWLNKLLPKEKDVIVYRYGLGVEKMKLEEIAKMFEITKERVRQIETRALEKLRRYSSSEKLDAQAREDLKDYFS